MSGEGHRENYKGLQNRNQVTIFYLTVFIPIACNTKFEFRQIDFHKGLQPLHQGDLRRVGEANPYSLTGCFHVREIELVAKHGPREHAGLLCSVITNKFKYIQLSSYLSIPHTEDFPGKSFRVLTRFQAAPRTRQNAEKTSPSVRTAPNSG